MYKEYVARQEQKGSEAKAAEYQRNNNPPLVEPIVNPVSGISDDTIVDTLKSKDLDSIYDNKQNQPSDLDSMMSSQDNQKSNLNDMWLGNSDEKPKKRSRKTKDN